MSEPKTVKNRVHLDLRAADVDAEADRLADPEGGEFCVQPDR